MIVGTSRSPKLAGLARSLEISKRDALGLLAMLWEWAWEQAPQGDIGRWEDCDIAEACGESHGSGQKVVSALVSNRWVDLDSVHRLIIHDHAEHVPEFVKKRLSRKHLEPLENGDGAERQTDGSRTAATPSTHGCRTESMDATHGCRTAARVEWSGEDRTGEEKRGEGKGGEENDLPVADAQALEPESKKVKPLAEQKGRIGDLARLWRARYSASPEWTGKHIKALHRLAKRVGDDAEMGRRFQLYLDDVSDFYAPQGHPLGVFIQHWDRWVASAARAETRRPSMSLGGRAVGGCGNCSHDAAFHPDSHCVVAGCKCRDFVDPSTVTAEADALRVHSCGHTAYWHEINRCRHVGCDFLAEELRSEAGGS